MFWYAGLGAGLVQLSDANGVSDATLVRFNTERALAPEASLLLGWRVHRGVRVLGGVSAQHIRWSAIRYRAPSEQPLSDAVLRRLPDGLRLTSVHLILGVGFDASELFMKWSRVARAGALRPASGRPNDDCPRPGVSGPSSKRRRTCPTLPVRPRCTTRLLHTRLPTACTPRIAAVSLPRNSPLRGCRAARGGVCGYSSQHLLHRMCFLAPCAPETHCPIPRMSSRAGSGPVLTHPYHSRAPPYPPRTPHAAKAPPATRNSDR